MGLTRYIASQLGQPRGPVGLIATAVMNRQNRVMYDETERQLSIKEGDHVLDIGFGNGFMLNALAKRYHCAFYGIDISEDMVKAASHRNRDIIEAGRLSLSSQNINSTRFTDSFFEKAYTMNTMYFWDDPRIVLSEIHRILKSNGVFVNAFYTNETLDRFSHTRYGFRRYQIELLLKIGGEVGFSVEMIPFRQGTAYCMVCRKR
ncbi:hypothetical protein AGMMS49992_16210 [Clostridia bacterium]|nr:hypothetical protein AGMMS49992_16210 [Clostridia bacterium]